MKKKILFGTGSNANFIGPVIPEDIAEIISGDAVNAATLADISQELARKVYAWYNAEKINYAQYDLFKNRLKKAPAVTDARLDGDVLVLSIAGGQEERILPTDANLPIVPVIGKKDTWKIFGVTWKKKYWIATFSATAVLIAVLAIVATKHH